MAELKTTQNDQSVDAFINAIEDEKRREECRTVLNMMREATGAEPRMWGDSIVGFGERHYRYATGREGDWFHIGFSPRKANLTLYVLPYDLNAAPGYTELLGKLGNHKTGKSCLYIKKMADVDQGVLDELIRRSAQDAAES
jgi:hypothetical protein